MVVTDTNGLRDIFVYDRQEAKMEIISVKDGGNQGNGNSYNPSISADGRYVAFHSYAENLVGDDTNSREDVFVYDRHADTIERVSLNNAGDEGDNDSFNPSISANGRFVSFTSRATNLVAGDTNTEEDIFVYDRQTDVIERVSVNNVGDDGDDDSFDASISADGKFVSFYSNATNLVEGDTNNRRDIFVYNRQEDKIKRVSINNAGNQSDGESYSPSISADGRFVSFPSDATNLI